MSLGQRISQLSPEQRKFFELKLKEQGIDISRISFAEISPVHRPAGKEVEPTEKKEYYPLSAFQVRMYILNLLMEYSLPLVYQVEGRLERDRFEGVFQELIKRHESFRTSIEVIRGEPVQKIHEYRDLEFKIEYEETEGDEVGGTLVSPPPRETRIKQFFRPFDLTRPPLLRVRLIRLSAARYIFLTNINHLIADGFSWGVLTRELIRLYKGEILLPLKIGYRDFSQWQNRWLKGADYKKHEGYWLSQFAGELPVLDLPTDYSRPAMQIFAGRLIYFEIAGKSFQALKDLAALGSASFFMVVLTVLNTLLFRYRSNRQEDVVIGTITAGREQRELQQVIGLFINTLALRNSPGRDKTFREFLTEVKQNTLAALENQSYPFGDLLERVIPKKDLSRNPLFDVMVVNQNRSIRELEAGGLRFIRQAEQEPLEHAQQDITLWVWEEENRLGIELEYCTALYKTETMERFAGHFLNLLTQAAENPALKLSELEMIGQEEKQQLVEQFNDPKTVFPVHGTIAQLLAGQVERTPDHVAVVGGHHHGFHQEGTEGLAPLPGIISLSYRELNKKSRQLAHWLRQKGVQPDTIVGIMIERSIEMVIGMWGILNAGGAYMPIDPAYPGERVKFMLADSGAGIPLGAEEIDALHPAPQALKTGPTDTSAHLRLSPWISAPITSLAYIIYTSGSTGKPKGVMIEHRNLTAYLDAFAREFEILPTDTVIQQASYSFDAFAEEVYPVLLKGGKLALPSREEVKDTALLTGFIRKHGVTIIDCSPLLLSQLNRLDFESPIRIFISGGDVLKGEYIDRLLRKGRVYNTYGPTEATICASYYRCPAEVPPLVPIGKPIRNYCISILDNRRRLLPVGVPGELCIAGRGVSRGYLNRPELTAEKFCLRRPGALFKKTAPGPRKNFLLDQLPITNHPSLFYRTGDLARWLPDGNIEFLGRIDRQVKIRGYRIELREIENRLLSHEGIKAAVVMDKDDENKDKYLYAYLVPREEKKSGPSRLSVAELRKYLAEELPDYMIPTHFIEIKEIPLTPNGKIDKKILDEYESGGSIEIGTDYAAPTDEIEKRLAGIWSEILKRDRIGIHDNFFDLGGQSILAIQATARIQEVFRVKIPLIQFFQVGTIRGIAEMIPGFRQDAAHRQPGDLSKRKGIVQPFELEKAPLLRIAVVELTPRRHFFFIDMHHIISDGISLDLIASEFTSLYQGNEPGELPIQYKDFSQWQGHFFNSRQFRQQEAYWLDIFNGQLPRLDLPLDYPRPEVRKSEGKRLQVEVGTELTLGLKRVAAQRQVTLFMLLLAAYTVFLAKTAGQEDIIVGTPVSGRTHAGVTRLQGMFVNTLALRLQPQHHLTFSEFLQNVKEQTLSALENQDYPFERLVEKLKLSGDLTRNPIFDTMFTVQQSYELNMDVKAGDLTFIPYKIEHKGSLFDLVLGAAIEDSDIHLVFDYNIHLFQEHGIQRMAGHFINMLSWIVQAPKLPIEDIDMSVRYVENRDLTESAPGASTGADLRENHFADAPLPIEISTARDPLTPRQKEWILREFNGSQMACPKEMTIHQLFERQAAAVPLRTAVIGGNRQLTYGELNRGSNRVAGLLTEMGLEPESFVGIMLEPSLELMVGLLGILKAGGCYLPIGPRHPEEHIRFQLLDASVRILLTHSSFQSPFLAKQAARVIPLDKLEYDAHNPNRYVDVPVTVKPGQLSYMIYTSGSTGRPKGVVADHRAVVNRLVWMQNTYPLDASDTILQKTTFTFDVSVAELFGWFMGGARLCFLGPKAETDLRIILDAIEIHHITYISFTPTVLHTFFLAIGKEGVRKLASLKWIFSAGEQLPVGLVETWSGLPLGTKLENLYGPTEAAVYASYYSCTRHAYPRPVPIGKPLGNTRLYVLSPQQELLPPGEVGELYLAGAGLARGYLNRPDLTAEEFLPDPFFPGERIYRTGDYAKLLPEGNMVYLGRMDKQVKIKGIRIELGEIETVLLKHPEIRKAAVIDLDDPRGVKYLAAYIVTRVDLTLKELRAHLREKFLEYMLPSVFFKVEHMPLTRSGKLDRKSLSQLGTAIQADNRYSAPGTQLEHQLAPIWAEILKLEQVGIDHNFFEMGGDSLRGNLLLAEINLCFNTGLLFKDLFAAPTIRKFAQMLSLAKAKKYTPITPVEKKEYYPASSPQKRLFIIHRLNKEETGYNLSMGMMIEGVPDKGRLKNTVKQLVQRHEPLRTRFGVRSGEIVQQIEDKIDFKVEFFAGKELGETWARVLAEEKAIIGIDPDLLTFDSYPAKTAAPDRREPLSPGQETVNDQYTAILPVEKKEYYALASAQKRVFILYKMNEQSRSYNIPFVLTLEGNPGKEKLEDTFRGLIRRHESLRTSFLLLNDEPAQRIHDRVEFNIEGNEGDPKGLEPRAKSYIKNFIRPFDLSKAPLMRVGLLETGKNRFLLLVDMHHIISDGVSYGILVEEFTALYGGEGLFALKLQYKDYSQWQNNEEQRSRMKAQERYWLEEFKGPIPRINFPTDYPRPAVQSFEGSVVDFELDRDMTRQLREIARQQGTTLFILLVSIYSIFLAKISHQEDIIIGTSVSGRSHGDLQRIMGMFVNVLALRNRIERNRSFKDLVRAVKRKTLQALENQDWPFDELVEKVVGGKDISRGPIFDIRFTYNNLEISGRSIPGFNTGPGEPGDLYQTSKFDLTLAGAEVEDKLAFTFEYCVKLFKEKSIKQYAEHFQEIVSIIIKNPGLRLKDINISHDLKILQSKADQIDLEF